MYAICSLRHPLNGTKALVLGCVVRDPWGKDGVSKRDRKPLAIPQAVNSSMKPCFCVQKTTTRSNMPKITQKSKHATKPTVIKAVTKVCTICTDKKPTTLHRCTTCKTSPTCNKCVKDWIMNDGGIIDATGKFVYTCPTCRAPFEYFCNHVARF